MLLATAVLFNQTLTCGARLVYVHGSMWLPHHRLKTTTVSDWNVVTAVLHAGQCSHLLASSCSGFDGVLLLLVEDAVAEEADSCSERHLSL